VLIAIGSTLQVYPVANMVPLAKRIGASVIVVNAEATKMDGYADVVVRGQIGEILPTLVARRNTRPGE
jgi:NAD-dependent deacetylase